MRKKTKTVMIGLIFPLVAVFPAAWVASAVGSNAGAGCAVDLDIATTGYDQNTISETDIETTVCEKSAGDQILLLLVAQNVTNLDTYQVEVQFDPARLAFVTGTADDSFNGIENILKKNAGNPIGFFAIEESPGKVNVAFTLSGNDPSLAPEGSGVLGILQFELLDSDYNNSLKLSDVYYIDTDGAQESPPISEEITKLTDARVNPKKRIVIPDCSSATGCFVSCENSILDAINFSDDGTEIEIMPGTYNERINVNRPLTIVIKDGKVTLMGNNSG